MQEHQTGIPYVKGSDLTVDDWSVAVFEALADWSIASGGEWTRWQPGHLVLEISRHQGKAIDRIVLDTADDELTVSFGVWERHIDGPDWPDPKMSVEEAKSLVDDWLSGRTRTAVYFCDAGKWRGTIPVDPKALTEDLAKGFEWLKGFSPAPVRIELRGPERDGWRFFEILADGSIREAP